MLIDYFNLESRKYWFDKFTVVKMSSDDLKLTNLIFNIKQSAHSESDVPQRYCEVFSERFIMGCRGSSIHGPMLEAKIEDILSSFDFDVDLSFCFSVSCESPKFQTPAVLLELSLNSTAHSYL